MKNKNTEAQTTNFQDKLNDCIAEEMTEEEMLSVVGGVGAELNYTFASGTYFFGLTTNTEFQFQENEV